MGKPTIEDYKASSNRTPLAQSSSSISLHTQGGDVAPAPERYFDEDPAEIAGDGDDLPPLYTDHENDAPADESQIINPLLHPDATPLQVAPFKRDETDGAEYYVDRRLDTDPVFLQEHLNRLALDPPRPHIKIRGTHSQTVRKGDGKTERKTVTDFDVQIELTYLLYRNIQGRRPFCRNVTPASNWDKVRRGTIFATRAPGFGGSGSDPEAGEPGLEEWCRRFCSDKAGLKAFTMERTVKGYDFDLIRTKIEALIRSTNYRGKVNITFPILNSKVEVYNECRTNRWRLTRWIYMIFVFTLMFIFSWPWLFFRTKRWDVIRVNWYMSIEDCANGTEYAVVSEERWYNMWARPIQKAILGRRQGTLDQADLARADEPVQTQTGFAGAVQAGVEAMGVVNRSFGWGGDS